MLSQPGKWTLGALVNNVFSYAGQSSRPEREPDGFPILGGIFSLGHPITDRIPVSHADEAQQKMMLEQKLKQMEQAPPQK